MSFEKRLRDQFPDIVFEKLPKPSENPRWIDHGFHPSVLLLERGHMRFEGRRPFGVNVIMHRDVDVTLRDGIKVYTDIFRPENSNLIPVPAIIAWSPYGKTGTGCLSVERIAPFSAGVSKDRTSGYESFEALDPAEWCERGYAVIQVDARGVGHSGGNISWWGTQEAMDVYDVIDNVSKKFWCNGSVAMAGNSWLAVSQVNFAARLSHTALKAIAPWEGKIDLYRDQLCRGGKPHIKQFHQMLLKGFAGSGFVEDIWQMIQQRPLFDDYWETKCIPVENIDIPIYIVASFASMLHVKGSFHTYRVAKSSHKWLRVHPHFEWYDLYRDDVNNDLQRFFDRYCKGSQNDWGISTPPVRLSVIGFHNSPARTITERPENEFPLKRQQLRKLFLDGYTQTLQINPIPYESVNSYESHSLTETLDFIFHFTEATEIIGYSKAVLFMSCEEHNDMDIAVQIRKIDSNGKPLEHINYPCPVPYHEIPNVNIAKQLGPQGFLRASHGVSRGGEDTPNDVFYTHRTREPVHPGTIMRMEIPLWPMGIAFASGEGIMLRVSGHDMCYPETEICRISEPEDDNIGYHKVHTGGQYESYSVLPFIPNE